MNSFFHWLGNPIILYLLANIIAGTLFFFEKKRQAWYFFLFGVVWMFMVGVSPLPQWLAFRMERQYPVFSLDSWNLEEPVHILVLGGGYHYDPSLPATMRLSRRASPRLVEGLRIYRLLPDSKVVGSGRSFSKWASLAEVQSVAAIELGISEEDTLQSREPRNTAEEIFAYKKRFGSSGSLIVVTSALHMPRTMLICRANGLMAIPAPADFFVKHNGETSPLHFKPSALKIELMQNVLHEYMGIVKEKFFRRKQKTL